MKKQIILQESLFVIVHVMIFHVNGSRVLGWSPEKCSTFFPGSLLQGKDLAAINSFLD